jgi:hypothetical protein
MCASDPSTVIVFSADPAAGRNVSGGPATGVVYVSDATGRVYASDPSTETTYSWDPAAGVHTPPPPCASFVQRTRVTV